MYSLVYTNMNTYSVTELRQKTSAVIKAALEKGYVHIIQNSKAKVAVVDSDYLTAMQEAYEDYLDHQIIKDRRDEPAITLEEYLKKDTIKL